MVKIENIEELRKIKESNYGFVIIITHTKSIIHNTDCKLIFEQDFLKDGNNVQSIIGFQHIRWLKKNWEI